ncbi:hypothetical protein EU527_13730 [Candidatus Thorarchaeota archaeon]|nr:MAG: hypothetical protein EU527_13730 [Candidatus Thorarchaeota archaeon]
MIAGAILYDLLGSKVLASLSFTQTEYTNEFLQAIATEYYVLLEEDAAKNFVSTKISEHAITISRIGDVTLIITISDTDSFTDDEIVRIRKLQWLASEEVDTSSVRNFKEHFVDLVDEHLRIHLSICFVIPRDLPPEDVSGATIEALVRRTGDNRLALSNPVLIGPYSVKSMQVYYDEIIGDRLPDNISHIHIFAMVSSKHQSELNMIEEAVLKIRSLGESLVIVIPSSDNELEYTRNLEYTLRVDLCDSVSPKPSYLLLAVLATSGYSDMHPELAREKWLIDMAIDTPKEQSQEDDEEELGHQAFFVVDRRTGEAIYSYYYEERSRILEMAPNIVAAITSFKIDQSKSAETSVFRTGELSYITIERNEYIFTLITGKNADVEKLRNRFSFLPDLFQDEVPELIDDPIDLFRSPLFTIKLLATLPPEDLPGRVAPKQKKALIWERFEHPSVRDFLQAVWQKLDGAFTVSRLVPSQGPELVLGAIHLLKRLDAIIFHIKITQEDAPILRTTPDAETLALYAQLDNILEFVNGIHTIQNIAMAMKMQPSVLVTVFTELHRRGVVTFNE